MTDKALMELICQLGQLHFEGNIVPPSWYQHLKYPSGKPYHIAITLLAEIVYWFRPRMVRDEHTGDFLGWAKKFRGDGIQRSYAAWGAPFGFTKRESADAIKYLVAECYITTDIRDVNLPDGTLRPNVVVVTSVSPDRLREITYSRRAGGGPQGPEGIIRPEVIPPEGYSVSTDGVLPRNVTPPAGYDISTEEVIPDAAGSSHAGQVEGMAAKGTCLETNIETILETEKETPYLPVATTLSTAPRQPEEAKISIAEKPPVATAVSISPTQPVVATPAQGEYPAILLKPKSRRAVLEMGQRAGRDDFAYPNVASAHAWVTKHWLMALVSDVSDAQAPAVVALLASLEGTLAALRERALRERKLTFTQVMDETLGQDEALRAMVRDNATPLSRLAEFAGAMQEVQAQWDDTPSSEDLSTLRSQLNSDSHAA